jgi:D-alanyl-D-alanine dipeptidase/tetratricopeptide (TPR) repeat protein
MMSLGVVLAAAAGLVDLADVAPSVQQEIRYATANNFTKQVIYPTARCLLQADAAARLARVQTTLQARRLGLKVFDCYRPLSAQKRLWAIVKDERYVADPQKGSRHNRGAAVDLTLVDASGRELDLGTPYDDFTPRAHRNARDLPVAARENRRILDEAMAAEGFVGLPTEWWHFDAPGWEKHPISDQPLTPRKASGLGKAVFPTSARADAQAEFERGLLLLHSFIYEEAREAFAEATRRDPGFLLGYAFEALSHNHPVWGFEELDDARAALARMPKEGRATARERAWIDAVRTLFHDGKHRLERAAAFEKKMAALAADQGAPDAVEAQAFHALSLFGKGGFGARGLGDRMRAAAIALDIYSRFPDHPGAAHYVIHAFDDPDHAILALPAARRYAEIAPEAFHARHMPSHIFVHLGMWPEALAANESSWAASESWIARRQRPRDVRDYHSLSWLIAVALELGKGARADEALAAAQQALSRTIRWSYVEMVHKILIETDRWDRADALLLPALATLPDSSAPELARPECHRRTTAVGEAGWAARLATTRGTIDLHRGRLDDAAARVKELAAIEARISDADDPDREMRDGIALERLLLDGQLQMARGRGDAAVATLEKAVALEAQQPESGPPFTYPASELLGDVLGKLGRLDGAAAAYERALARHPNRSRALLGLARVEKRRGRAESARAIAARLVAQWIGADAGWPPLAEARALAR